MERPKKQYCLAHKRNERHVEDSLGNICGECVVYDIHNKDCEIWEAYLKDRVSVEALFSVMSFECGEDLTKEHDEMIRRYATALHEHITGGEG